MSDSPNDYAAGVSARPRLLMALSVASLCVVSWVYTVIASSVHADHGVAVESLGLHEMHTWRDAVFAAAFKMSDNDTMDTATLLRVETWIAFQCVCVVVLYLATVAAFNGAPVTQTGAAGALFGTAFFFATISAVVSIPHPARFVDAGPMSWITDPVGVNTAVSMFTAVSCFGLRGIARLYKTSVVFDALFFVFAAAFCFVRLAAGRNNTIEIILSVAVSFAVTPPVVIGQYEFVLLHAFATRRRVVDVVSQSVILDEHSLSVLGGVSSDMGRNYMMVEMGQGQLYSADAADSDDDVAEYAADNPTMLKQSWMPDYTDPEALP